MGPTWYSQQDQARAYARLGMQRATPASKRVLHMLLHPGLGPNRHVQEALSLPSPFAPKDYPDDDVWFAAEAIATWGQYICEWRKKQQAHLSKVLEATAALTRALRQYMPTNVARVASKKRPGFLAVCIIALRWPDRQQPME